MVLMGRSWRSLGFLGWREQMAGQLCGHLLAIQLHSEDKSSINGLTMLFTAD
jgi:hypothetical protein